MYSIGSCFSGIGGLELGLEWTGRFETKWQIEMDDYATKILEKHWPKVRRYKDIRDVVQPERVDLICGGFPCQDVSLAGTRHGLEGKRSTLWGEMHRLVCEVKPRWVLAENVPGLLSSDGGRFFGRILRDLAEIGYDAEWQVLSAKQFGASHLRRRLFILAYPKRLGLNKDENKACFSDQICKKSHFAWGNTRALHIKDNGGTLWGFPDSDIHRSFDGFSDWMDRLKCLGNAVVPQATQKIGEMILDFIEGGKCQKRKRILRRRKGTYQN